MFPFASRVPLQDRRNYILDAVAGAYYGFFLGFSAPFVPVILKRLEATPFEMGLSLAAPFLSLVVAFPFYRFLKGFRALDLVTIPTFFSRFCVAFIGLSSTTRWILAFFVVAQFVESLGLAAYTRVLKEMYTPQGRGLAMGLVRFFIAGAMIAGSAMGGLLMDQGHFFLPFLLAGISGSVSSFGFWHMFPRDRSPLFSPVSIGPRDILRTLAGSEAFFWLNVTVLFFGFGNLLVVGSLPTMLVDRFHITNASLGYLNGLTSLLQMGSYVAIGALLGRIGGTRGLLVGMAAGVANPLVFYFAPRLEWLAIPFALTGVMNASFDLCWPVLVLTMAPETEIGVFASVYTLHMGMRGLVAMFTANLALPQLGTGFFFGLGGTLMVLGLAVGWLLLDKWESPVSNPTA
ncbi:MAG: MFS transporter [Candidatus Riflebacteria bacterium]|nr:MFS transporter [Candidatus Riflebacteria bacterium]